MRHGRAFRMACKGAPRDLPGEWPKPNTGSIRGVLGETWAGINHALRRGSRGLPKCSSLAQFLATELSVPNPAAQRKASPRRKVADLMPLTEEQILAWADAHY